MPHLFIQFSPAASISQYFAQNVCKSKEHKIHISGHYTVYTGNIVDNIVFLINLYN